MCKISISILMGSDSDKDIMLESANILKTFDVGFDISVTSAHRSPNRTRQIVKQKEQQGTKIFIVGAGRAAHLPGVIAAETCLPVIGIPIETSPFNGLDSLLSIVQMPGGVPVATMATGKTGAKNAALLAIQILALSDDSLKDRLKKYKNELEKSVVTKANSIEKLSWQPE
ncbi:MAG: 5-(carboxyamino)imidazole ribonucleotide mutase [Candidatus Schekmanbacteria bacterium RBG_13_48_7]|uniref:N5-carboxyaminoimidazole ribonucleotide mutase n=1 Tax=Candidatus Schekmanbacteria bacterium RBG_13_48_7 TaxID=1817878 RepID=A0A1F7S047_9BACT|nr:MAG: 5-(carboxyamino)imidazole ribonucleotide mutase [Candidatus Schekmanbacteria bacterium RBG_13_48_7]